MVTEKMKRCPFCGGKPEFRRSGRSGHYIACSSCDSASTMFTAAKDDVEGLLIETWNRRPSCHGPSQQQKFEYIVENALRIWFGNYDQMDESDKETYRVAMREIVSFVAASQVETIPCGWNRTPERYSNYPWSVDLYADGWHLSNHEFSATDRDISVHGTAAEAMAAAPAAVQEDLE